jgi:histidinol-phosphate/aromatic aminotransferase/cobyric acid decarboxylase-like protein
VDFADEADNTLIDQKILDANKHLFVMKSISKSYGVPGLRLGVLASGDERVIADLKRDVAIWNINSFAEFYMQIEEKYKKDYVAALIRFRAERARYFAELEKIPSIRVIPSQANYVMVEIRSDMTSKELTKRLLLGYNLFVKDLSGKMGGKQYLRLAVRTTEDNNKLIEALRKELS